MWFVDRVLQPKSIDVEVDARLKGTIVHQALFTFFTGPAEASSVPTASQPETLEDALVFLRECLDDALVAHVRFDLPELRAQRARAGPRARPREARAPGGGVRARRSCRSRFEVSFGSERSAPELQRGLELDGFAVSGKIDRIDPTRSAPAGSSATTSPARRADGPRDRPRAPPADPALHARPARPGRDRAARRRSTARSPATRAPRGLLRDEAARTTCRASCRTTTSTRRTSGVGSSARASTRAGSSARIRRRRRPPRPARRRCPPGATSGRCAG